MSQAKYIKIEDARFGGDLGSKGYHYQLVVINGLL